MIKNRSNLDICRNIDGQDTSSVNIIPDNLIHERPARFPVESMHLLRVEGEKRNSHSTEGILKNEMFCRKGINPQIPVRNSIDTKIEVDDSADHLHFNGTTPKLNLSIYDSLKFWKSLRSRIKDNYISELNLYLNNPKNEIKSELFDENLAILAMLKLNKRACPGIDEVTLSDFASDPSNWKLLISEIKGGKYSANNSKIVFIPKYDFTKKTNGKREIRIPTTRDKVAQKMVELILTPRWECKFKLYNSSYGYREGISVHMAFQDILKIIPKMNYFLDLDLKAYFDTIPHNKLLEMVKKDIHDPIIIKTIYEFLISDTHNTKIKRDPNVGTPQGSIISPLLSNIYLHETLDSWLPTIKNELEGNCCLFRYADDFLILSEKEVDNDLLWIKIQERLQQFDLTISMEKSKKGEIGTNPIPFLGLNFYKDKLPQLSLKGIRNITINIMEKINIILLEKPNVSIVIKSLDNIIMGLYAHYKYPEIKKSVWRIFNDTVRKELLNTFNFRKYIKGQKQIKQFLRTIKPKNGSIKILEKRAAFSG